MDTGDINGPDARTSGETSDYGPRRGRRGRVVDAEGTLIHKAIGPQSVDEFVAFLQASLGLAANAPRTGA